MKTIYEEHKENYILLAELVIYLTKFESFFSNSNNDELGGNGIWEKYEKNMKHNFDEKFGQSLMDVAEVRNKAIHEYPNINEIKKAIDICKDLDKQIKKRFKTRLFLNWLKPKIKKFIFIIFPIIYFGLYIFSVLKDFYEI